MALPLFVYGTLRDPDLLCGVLGRPLSGAAMLPAVAPGFVAVHYPDRIYPALVRKPGGSAEGLVLTDLSPFERDLLDAFEGSEYDPAPVPVMIGEELHEAVAYLPTATIAASAEPWTLAAWQRRHKRRVLPAETAAARDIRMKLIAVRPN